MPPKPAVAPDFRQAELAHPRERRLEVADDVVRPVGVFHMEDEKGPDDKVICVPRLEPATMRISDIHDVPAELRNEIEHFFQVYKDLEEKKTETYGFGNRADAETLIEQARARRT